MSGSAAAAYHSVDPLLEEWIASHKLMLFRRFAGRDARFCYTSSDRGECFQISIDAPGPNEVTVHAWDVDTLDGEELHKSWTVPPGEVGDALDAARAVIETWKMRALRR